MKFKVNDHLFMVDELKSCIKTVVVESVHPYTKQDEISIMGSDGYVVRDEHNIYLVNMEHLYTTREGAIEFMKYRLESQIDIIKKDIVKLYNTLTSYEHQLKYVYDM